MPADIQSYIGQASAWHRSGIVTGRPMRGNEFFDDGAFAAELDYQVSTSRAYFKTVDGTEVPVDKTVAIYRGPIPKDPHIRSFGAASDSYHPIQNRTIAQIIDPMTEHWPIVTAGALGVGELVWFLLEIGDVEIARELHKRYVVISNSHKPGQGLVTKPVDERIVCRNTHAIALNERGVTISLRHTRDIEANFRHIMQQMEVLRQQTKLDVEALQALADWAAISNDQAEEMRQSIIEAAYPEPRRPRVLTIGDKSPAQKAMEHAYELSLARMQKYRLMAYDACDRLYSDFPHIAKTPYAAYQAVLEVVDHKSDTPANARNALWGEGSKLKQQAFKAALELVN